MKNYKKLITGSLLLAFILSTPALSFADNEKNGKENESNGKIEKVNKEDNKTNWFSNWFDSNSSKNDKSIPVISNFVINSNKINKATLKWNTDLRSNTMVWYSTTAGVDTTKDPNIKRGDRTKKHKIELNRLAPDTTYYAVVGSANSIGLVKSAEMSFTTNNTGTVTPTPTPVPDTKAPVISDIETRINKNNVVISWETDEPSSSKVFYAGATPVNVDASSTLSVSSDSLVKKHIVQVPSLTSNTLYHFILKSVDASNNAALSSESAFITN